MALTLYYGSGSPYAWRVQLALEHKALPYELKVLSFSAGDTRKPEFLALNPRHQVPVLSTQTFRSTSPTPSWSTSTKLTLGVARRCSRAMQKRVRSSGA